MKRSHYILLVTYRIKFINFRSLVALGVGMAAPDCPTPTARGIPHSVHDWPGLLVSSYIRGRRSTRLGSGTAGLETAKIKKPSKLIPVANV